MTLVSHPPASRAIAPPARKDRAESEDALIPVTGSRTPACHRMASVIIAALTGTRTWRSL